MEVFEDKLFEQVDYSTQSFPKGEYEACRFINCNFQDADFSLVRFVDCDFQDCNLSMLKLGETVFNGIAFANCKMLGIHFENSSDLLFSVSFINCTLQFSSFYKRNLKQTKFNSCDLRSVDFTEADLQAAVFSKCDLADAKFESTNLENANLSTAFNFTIDPHLNKIKKAKFSLDGLPGLLRGYDITIER